jgi:hypothetical protein
MKKAIISSVLVIFLMLNLAALGFAQRQTGSLSGRVTDKEKNPLPGASVSISGPALLGIKSYVTSDTGLFRFSTLLPGGYEIRAEMPGFKTAVYKGLTVGVGKTTEVTIELEQAEVEEEVLVVGVNPIVDPTMTKISVNYSAQFLASIPMNRDLYDIQNSVPGAISEGAEYRRTSSILGGTVRSQLYALDGVPMNDPATFYSMANINVDVYEEIEFEVGAHPAEVGQTDSTYINIVTKSGGNSFSGGATVYYTGKSLAEDLIPAVEQETMNVNPPEKYSDSKDFSLNLGGPIFKDRTWFFLNGRRLVWRQDNPLNPESRMAKLGFVSSPHYDIEHQEWLAFGKLTFQVAKNLRYMGMLHYNHIYEPVYSNSTGSESSFEFTEIWDHENTYTTTHQLNWVLDQDTFLDIRGTYIYRYFPIHSRQDGEYTYYDYKEKVYWGTSEYNDEYVRKKMLASVSLTHFHDDLLGASHEFKAGAEFEQSEYHRDWYRPNPYYAYYNDYARGDVYYYSGSKKQGRLRIRTCTPEKGLWDVQDHVRRYSAYVQDSISAGKMTVNLGLRLDHSYQYEPQQTRPKLVFQSGPKNLAPGLGPNALVDALTAQLHAQGKISPFEELTTPYKKVVTFTTLSPRIGLAYDPFGDGKTVLKASFSRYYEPIWSAKYNGGQIFGASTINYRWNDLNGNKFMDLPPADTYELTSYPEQDPDYSYYGELRPPFVDEILAGIEREVAKDFILGLDFVWKQNKNIVEDFDILNGYDIKAKDAKGLIWIPFTFIDPGWDQSFGTSDDESFTVYGLRSDRPTPSWKGGNPPEAKRKYWAAILSFEKRLSNRWQLKGSVLYSSFKGNCDPGYSATEGESTMFDNPNTLINAYGPLGFDRPLQIKIMGSCILPYDFVFSAYFQARSGSPWGRTLARVYFPLNYGVQESYVGISAEEPGEQRTAPYTTIDLRVEKGFSLGQFGKLNLYVDIFNVAGRSGVSVDSNPAGILRSDKTPATYELSTTYGLVTSIYGVRSFRLGARLNF